MAKKRDKFYSEVDFLRHQLRELAEEVGTVIKDTNFMKKEECKEEITALNRVKYRKEVETETRENIENLERELTDRNNQITTLEKKKVILENEKKSCMEIILEKDKRMDTQLENIKKLKTEIEAFEIAKQGVEKAMKELQESNEFMNETIENNKKELLKKEKEISELRKELEDSHISLANKSQIINKLREEVRQLRNRKWYDPFLFWKK